MDHEIATPELTKAINRGISQALREHALLGQSVSVWKDGKVVELSPEEILKELDTKAHRNGSAHE